MQIGNGEHVNSVQLSEGAPDGGRMTFDVQGVTQALCSTPRVSIFGRSGAGKSTLARLLSEATGRQHHDLDLLWQEADGTPREPSDCLAPLATILDQPFWIVEGSYDPRQIALRSDMVVIIESPAVSNLISVGRRSMTRMRSRSLRDVVVKLRRGLGRRQIAWFLEYVQDVLFGGHDFASVVEREIASVVPEKLVRLTREECRKIHEHLARTPLQEA